jgi:hypothetical protein
LLSRSDDNRVIGWDLSVDDSHDALEHRFLAER